MKIRLSLLVIWWVVTNVFAQQDSLNRWDNAGQRHGLWIKKYANGHIWYSGKFIHGKETGIFKFYTPDNDKHPYVTKDYDSIPGKIYVRFYDTQGCIESEGIMTGKQRQGLWKFYFPGGKIRMSTEEYLNGKKNGEVIIYYKNGTVAKKMHYKNGKLDGTSEVFGTNGKLLELMTYKNGKAEGHCETYEEDGKLFSKGQYRNGKKTGVWEFHINGKTIRTEHPEWVHRKDFDR